MLVKGPKYVVESFLWYRGLFLLWTEVKGYERTSYVISVPFLSKWLAKKRVGDFKEKPIINEMVWKLYGRIQRRK